MDSHHIVSSFATAAVVGVIALSGGGPGATSPTGGSAAAASSVCAGVSNCHVVATTDVDGDGRSDHVGWRQMSERSVQIRVRTADGRLVSTRVDVRLWWGGGAWGGATRVDHRAGSELLVGSTQGAHTPMYTMLTYRAGRLAVEKSPSPLSPLWQVDAAYGDYLGWWRHILPDGRVGVTQRIAVRRGDTARFLGRDVTYAWSANRWVRTSVTPTAYPAVRLASEIGGFQVAGLAAFPGLG